MPEILTKHPEIVIKILEEEGIKCARGDKPQILTKCPKESFCALKSGELCIYGVDQFSQMTQIKAEDLGIPQPKPNPHINYGIAFGVGFLVAFLLFKRTSK